MSGSKNEIAERLKACFNEWDKDKKGVIPAETLQEVLKKLSPSFADRDVQKLIEAAQPDENGLVEYDKFIDFLLSDVLASAAGAPLPTGKDSDAKASRLLDCVARCREKKPGLKASMQDMKELLDPHQHPSGYRFCQSTALNAGGVGLLLTLTGGVEKEATPMLAKDSDAIRSLAWELLARLSFGNSEAADAIASEKDLLPRLQTVLNSGGGTPPEQLSALQLVQAVATGLSNSCSALVPQLLATVVPLLSLGDFRSLQEAAFDILVSCSRSHATAVVEAVGWQKLAKLTAEDIERPAWLPAKSLNLFLSGRLAVDIISSTSMPVGALDKEAREAITVGIGKGRFLGLYIECLEAATDRREWPIGTEAYHSVVRLAELALRLAALGHHRQLVKAIVPLIRAVESGEDNQTSRGALRALFALCEDVSCLEAMLAMHAFRSETLETLHKAGDEPEATELLSYLETMEQAFADVRMLLQDVKDHARHAPEPCELAEIFRLLAPLDKELNPEQVLQAATKVPLLPHVVKATVGSSNLNFTGFAARVYGTPTILGWWPSQMEDVAQHLEQLGPVPGMPGLGKLVELFEEATGGKKRITPQVILDVLLPAASLPTEGTTVESAIIALGTTEMGFLDLVQWLGRLCISLEDDRKEKEASEKETLTDAA